jgi:multiple sugar transport system ATP-binding protein
MGSPAMNLISAQVETGGRISLERRGTEAISLPLPSSLVTPVQAGQKVIFGIRPEAITDLGGADQAAKCIETVPAQVEVVEPAGADTFVISHLGGKEVIARMRADVSVAPGDLVPFAFNMDKALLFDAASGVRL